MARAATCLKLFLVRLIVISLSLVRSSFLVISYSYDFCRSIWVISSSLSNKFESHSLNRSRIFSSFFLSSMWLAKANSLIWVFFTSISGFSNLISSIKSTSCKAWLEIVKSMTVMFIKNCFFSLLRVSFVVANSRKPWCILTIFSPNFTICYSFTLWISLKIKGI